MPSMYQFVMTANASGAGTFTMGVPLTGQVVEFRMDNSGTAFAPSGGTTNFTFTRVVDGGTILKLTNAKAPFDYYPTPALNSVTGGTTAYATGIGPVVSFGGVPIVASDIQCVVSSAGTAAVGTVFVYMDKC